MTAQQTTDQRIAARRRAIFAACKAAGLDDDARRAIVRQVTGCARLADCNLAQVPDHLTRGKDGYAGRKRATASAERAPLLSKVDALLAELHRVTGEVKPLSYADGIARRSCKRSSLDFCDEADLRKVVAALTSTLRNEIAKRVP